MQDARAKRNLDQRKEVAQKAKEWRDQAIADNLKRKRTEGKPQQAFNSGASGTGGAAGSGGSAGAAKPSAPSKPQQGGLAKPADSGPAPADLKFGKIEVEDDLQRAKKERLKGHHKPSTKQLLAAAEAKQAAAAALDPDDAGLQAEAWQAALARASGQKARAGLGGAALSAAEALMLLLLLLHAGLMLPLLALDPILACCYCYCCRFLWR